MTKNEYMKSLKSALSVYDGELSAEIIEEFENHFAEGLASGMSEEELIDELGPVREVADNIGEMYEVLGNPNSVSVQKEEEKTTGGELEVIVEKKSTDGDKAEHGLVLADVDTIIIDGNLEVNLVRGTGDGYWEYKPSFSMNFGFSLWQGFFKEKEQFEINVERYNRTLRFNMPKGSGSLMIEVPEYVRVIEIYGKSSDVEIADLNLQDLRLSLLAGDCDIRNCRVDRIDVESKSGDFATENVHGDMKIVCFAGDVDIKDHQGPRVDIDALAGDVEINTSSPCVEVSAKAGDVDVEMFGPVTQVKIEAFAGDVDLQTASKDYTAQVSALAGDIDNRTDLAKIKQGRGTYIIGNGAGLVKLKTMAGDVTLK